MQGSQWRQKFMLQLSILLLITLTIPFGVADSNIQSDIPNLINQANVAYSQKQYAEAAKYFSAAIDKGDNDPETFYNAACCYALTGDKNKAFSFLESAILNGFEDVEHLTEDPDLESLHSNIRWHTIVEKCRTNYEKNLVTALHARVKFTGIEAKQAQALADTMSAARDAYVRDFGFSMPNTLIGQVTCADGEQDKLFTDGNDSLFLSMPNADRLAKPDKSKVYVLYGICHEIGHMAMYRTLNYSEWMTSAMAEGWAHYAGSMIVDRVYA